MKGERWRLIVRLCVVLALAALAMAWWGYTDCVLAMTDGMTRELNPLTEVQLKATIDGALSSVEEVPVAFGDRAGLAHPICYDANSISDNGVYYALFVFLLIVALFCRNQGSVRGGPVVSAKRHGNEFGSSRSEEVPDEIDVGDVTVGLTEKDKRLLESVGEFNVRDESLMLYLKQPNDEEEEENAAPEMIDGFFCPPGYQDKPILYVDPAHADASDELAGEDPINNADRPFTTLSGAIEMARALLGEGGAGVMLRVMPGVYHASIDVPDKVVICNHRLPAEGTSRSRLQWLTAQSVDDPNNVTILAPANAVYAVQFESGVRQGIFGCHIVGRETVKQAGIVAVNCRALAIINCSIEGFIGGGVRLQDSGTELAGGAVALYGCRLHRNESRIGGALYAERSSVRVIDCIIERNKALTGGAIYGIDLRAPLFITTSRIAYNRAQLDESPEVDVDGTELERWQQLDGLGGGVYLRNSKLKVVGAEFVENGASVAGAGIALLNAKAVLESADDTRVRFARNKSRVGAGLVAIGWVGARATLKCTDAIIEDNHASVAGGGFAAIGMSTVQVFDSEFQRNEVSGPKGLGAGAVVWNGAELLTSGVDFVENKTVGSGGGVAVVNGRLSMKDESRLRANVAKRSGGGIYVITTAGKVAASLVKTKQVKVPFVVTLTDVKIVNNVSGKLGGGMRGGNELRGPSLPLGIKFGENVRFQLNRTKSQKENGEDFWIVWGGEVKGTDRDRAEKLVLR